MLATINNFFSRCALNNFLKCVSIRLLNKNIFYFLKRFSLHKTLFFGAIGGLSTSSRFMSSNGIDSIRSRCGDILSGLSGMGVDVRSGFSGLGLASSLYNRPSSSAGFKRENRHAVRNRFVNAMYRFRSFLLGQFFKRGKISSKTVRFEVNGRRNRGCKTKRGFREVYTVEGSLRHSSSS